MGSGEAIREGQIISHDDTAKPVSKHGYRPPLPRAQVIAWAIRRGAWEQNSRVQSVMEGNRSHGHSDQGLRRFNVRAIFRGICGLNTSRHDELDETALHEANRQEPFGGQRDQYHHQISGEAYRALYGCDWSPTNEPTRKPERFQQR